MTVPFTKRGKYKSNVYLDKNAFISLTDRLNQAGFSQISIKLPLDEITSERARKKAIPLEEFLKQDRNYKGLILLAKNRKEEVRILFRNQGEANFFDDIFPSIGSYVPYNYYISSNDPVRTQGLSLFLNDFFEEYVVVDGGKIILVIVCALIIANFAFIIFFNKKPLIYFVWTISVVAFFAGLYFLPQTGLYFHSPEDAKKLPRYIEELKKQWLVLLVAAILALMFGFLGDFFKKWLGLTGSQ